MWQHTFKKANLKIDTSVLIHPDLRSPNIVLLIVNVLLPNTMFRFVWWTVGIPLNVLKTIFIESGQFSFFWSQKFARIAMALCCHCASYSIDQRGIAVYVIANRLNVGVDFSSAVTSSLCGFPQNNFTNNSSFALQQFRVNRTLRSLTMSETGRRFPNNRSLFKRSLQVTFKATLSL